MNVREASHSLAHAVFLPFAPILLPQKLCQFLPDESTYDAFAAHIAKRGLLCLRDQPLQGIRNYSQATCAISSLTWLYARYGGESPYTMSVHNDKTPNTVIIEALAVFEEATPDQLDFYY